MCGEIMEIAGIICEYNPFHLGHARQLQLLREALGADTAVISAMSGNYVQRGMPAAWDKSTRAAAAVAAGVDLVLELPVTGVLSSAEGFARTGVEILHRLGIVDYLCFGSETGAAAPFEDLAQMMETPAYVERLRQALGHGLSYPAARQQAAGALGALLRRPNDILALEYIRALRSLNASLRPLAIARGGDYHATTPDAQEPSATALRAMLPGDGWKNYVPSAAAAKLGAGAIYDLRHGERAVLARLRAMTGDDWAQCAHGSEGLWCKAQRAAASAESYNALLWEIKSRRYPLTRIQRLVLCAYLVLTQRNLARPIPYVRILACNERGRTLIRAAKARGSLPLVNAGAKPPDADYFALEIRCTDLFTLFAPPGTPTPCGCEQQLRIQFQK